MKMVWLLFLSIILVACQKNSAAPGAVENETPVKFVICGKGDSNCFVSSSHRNLSDCESHKKMTGMLCDSFSDNNSIVCKEMSAERLLDTPTYCISE